MPMTSIERAVALEQAAKLLSDVAASLDRSVERCGTCTLSVWQNKHEHQIARDLDGMVGKLCRISGMFRSGAAVEPLEDRR